MEDFHRDPDFPGPPLDILTMNTSPTFVLPTIIAYADPRPDSHALDRAASAADMCLRVWQVRAALAAMREYEFTNVLSVRTNPDEPAAIEFELARRVDGGETSGFRTRGMQVRGLREFFANQALHDGDLTNVSEVRDLGSDCLVFQGPDGHGAERRTYFVEGGDSSHGEVGFVAYVEATSPARALKKLRAVSIAGNSDALTFKHEDVEVRVLINPRNLKAELWDMDCD